jgi:hypothetical protein
VPEELERFQTLPMKVVFSTGGQPAAVDTKVLRLVGLDAETGASEWALADVRVNRQGGKGQRISKKQAAQRFSLSPADIRQVNLHIEI